MARGNDRWLIAVLLVVLAVFGFVCVSQRGPSNGGSRDPFPASGGALPTSADHAHVLVGVDDNIEIIDVSDANAVRHTTDDVDTLDDPRYGSQFGVGPNPFGRSRPTSEL